MRADVLVGPSPWIVDRLGAAVAGELWSKIPEALSTAISRAANAGQGSAASVDRLLANPRWALPYEELAECLRGVRGAQVVTASRSIYQLVVVAGHVVVPWCYGQNGAVSMRDVRPGRSFGRLAREMLPRVAAPVARGSRHEVPLLRDEIDEREVAQVAAGLARLGPDVGVLFAGYAGTPTHGLLRACLGEPTVDERGSLGWRNVDDLPLPPPQIPRPRRLRFP